MVYGVKVVGSPGHALGDFPVSVIEYVLHKIDEYI